MAEQNRLMSVWKFPLKVEARQQIPLPQRAGILHLDVQNGQLCIWALVSPSAQPVDRTFHVYGTGHEIDGNADIEYVGSAQQGAFVWHVFVEAPAHE